MQEQLTSQKDDKADAKTFDDFDTLGSDPFQKAIGEDLQISSGDDHEVAALANAFNTGKAIADNDVNIPGADYPVAKLSGVEIFVHKASKDDFYFVMDVPDALVHNYNEELKVKKQKSALSKAMQQGSLWYDVPPWIMFDLLLNHGVHPNLHEKHFEKVLWREYPDLWIDTDRAPKRA